MTKAIRLMDICLIIAISLMMSACALPRGAGVEREIIAGSNTEEAGFALYPVTRDFLPTLESWPVQDKAGLKWINASSGHRGQVIAPGDIVTITIWSSNENSLLTAPGQRMVALEALKVSTNGAVFLPYIGDTMISGMSPHTARRHIQDKIATIAPDAQVQIAVKAGRQNAVDLVSGVTRPGTFPMPDRSYTILSLIAEGGGATPDLRNPQIRLMRGNSVYGTSLNSLYSNPNLNTRLRGGDKIIIEEDERYFLSLGAAGSQAQHGFSQDVVSALDAISIIGGVAAERANPEGILILREYPKSALENSDHSGPSHQRVVFSLDLTSSDGLFSARHFRIQSNDLVLATESPVNSVVTVLNLLGSAFSTAKAAIGL